MSHCRVLCLAIVLISRTVAEAEQGTIFSVLTEEVRVDVLVTDRGKPLPSLSATDFEILDNGVPQEIRYARLQRDVPISTVLVCDMSRSVAGETLGNLKKAALGLLSDLNAEDHAALLTFNHALSLGSLPTRDLAAVRRTIEEAQPSGNSSLIDAVYAGLLLAGARQDPTLLIVFSDGCDTFSWLTSEAVLQTAKRNEAVVYAVSASRLPRDTFLADLARITGGSLFQIGSSRDLAVVFGRILEEFRQRYLLTYVPRGVAGSGWHRLDVRVKTRSAKIRARAGYMRSTPSK
jgi:Ca-activated chloride channel homolog